MNSFYSDSLDELKDYALGVNLPASSTSATDTTNVTTVATGGTPTAFALSTADVLTATAAGWGTASARKATYNGLSATWLLRSPHTATNGARTVNTTGIIGGLDVTSSTGVRPALYINPES